VIGFATAGVIESGSVGGCPLLVFGITSWLYVED
jgi:hypothetical protein